MSRAQLLRALVNQRLNAAVDEIFGIFETTIKEYEEEIDRQRRLLENVLNPETQINKAAPPQLFFHQVEDPPKLQQWSPGLEQEDPEPRHIKEEQEELWSSQEGEQLQGLEEADITKFPFTPVPVKSEKDEEKAQSSQAEPLASSSTEHMKTEADGEDCGVSEAASDGKLFSTDCSEAETEDSDDDWKETGEPQSGLDRLENKNTPVVSSGNGPFSCMVCGKIFSSEEQMNTHMIIHSEKKLFSCPICGKGFNKKPYMHAHLRRHTGDRPFSCSVCGKSFAHKRDMQTHMRRHTGEKPFSCTVCGKRFIQSSSLVKHMRCHTGDKPFSCSVCGKRFSQSGTVGIHMRSHSAERPFSCSVCGKSYKEKGSLRKHMRVHTGETPYSCSVCRRSYSSRMHLNWHKCGTKSSSG